MSQNEGYRGEQGAYSEASDYNAQSFLINQILNGRNVATLVQIKAVTNSGDLSPVGYVDVLPLVNQLDGDNKAVPHGVVHNLPYFRMQGGTDAIILDPKVGDIGLAVFADRDISAVKANKKAANPGSKRRASMADGLYIGGFLNGVPDQYVQFSAAGIAMVSPTAINFDAPSVTMTAPTIAINASTSVAINTPSLTHNGKNIGDTHAHSGVSPGGSNTGSPV